MEWFEALALLLGAIVFLMALGMPVALAFLAANILGAWVFMGGERGVVQLLNNGLGSLTKYALVPIPLFLLMGELFFHTGLGGRMFNAIDKLLGRLPGRLSYVTVMGGTAFSTLSGSSMGSTALLGSLMVPEMGRRGYKRHMSIGPILGTGGLALIIPPSALAVLLATLAQIDVAALLIAGVIPGLTLAGFYIVTIWLQPRIAPEAAPAYDVPPMSLADKLWLILREIIRHAHAPRPTWSKRFLEQHDCWDEAAPSEREVLARRRRVRRPLLSMRERAWRSWRVEALAVLLWGLGLVEITHRQGPTLDLSGSMPATDGEAVTDFIRSAKLRPSSEVRQQCDLLYCIHNGVRSLSVPRAQITTDLIIEPGVIHERHYAINWLAGVDADWDDVDTST